MNEWMNEWINAWQTRSQFLSPHRDHSRHELYIIQCFSPRKLSTLGAMKMNEWMSEWMNEWVTSSEPELFRLLNVALNQLLHLTACRIPIHSIHTNITTQTNYIRRQICRPSGNILSGRPPAATQPWHWGFKLTIVTPTGNSWPEQCSHRSRSFHGCCVWVRSP